MTESEEVDPVPKTELRSLSVTPQHFADLKVLEEGGSFVTPEHPSIVRHYFRGIALRFESFDKEFRREVDDISKITIDDVKKGYEHDVRLWRVQIVEGAKITVTKLRPRYGDKVSVRVEQGQTTTQEDKERNGSKHPQSTGQTSICLLCKQTVPVDTYMDQRVLRFHNVKSGIYPCEGSLRLAGVQK